MQLLGSSTLSVDAQEAAAAYVLSAVAGLTWLPCEHEEALRHQILAEPVLLKRLVQLLRRSSCSSQRAAAEALCFLANGEGEADIKQQVIGTPGAVTGLVQLAASSTQSVQKAARGALISLFFAKDLALVRQVVAVPGAVGQLVGQLSSSDWRLKENAENALFHMVVHGDTDLALLQQLAAVPGAVPGAVRLLVALLRRNGSQAVQQGMQKAAARALRGLMFCSDLAIKQQVAALPGAVEQLVMLLSNSSCSVQAAAAWALCNLVVEDPGPSFRLTQQVAGVPGAVQQLVVLLSSSNQEVQRAAAWTLCNLARGNLALKQQIAAVPGAVEQLGLLLSSSSGGVQEAAAMVLC
jgi:hypothetical protein